jgi:hypothetical protein
MILSSLMRLFAPSGVMTESDIPEEPAPAAPSIAPTDPTAPRQPGLLRGLVVPDDFFAPLTDAELADWE